MRSLILVLPFLLTPAIVSEAFENAYKCRAVAETTVGYHPRSAQVEASSTTKLKRPYAVVISGVNEGTPTIHGQATSELAKLLETAGTIWFAEQAAAGTVILWTLLDRDELRPPTLISTKSYSFFGAASFTAFYLCE